MKEVMIPYVLIMWILVSTGAIKWNFRNASWIVSGGVFILVILGILSRLWAPVDMTSSSTVKAPHAVLSPLVREQIDTIHVTHNQHVKKGDIIYTLVDTTSYANLEKIKAGIVQQEEYIAQMERDITRSETSPTIFKKRDVESYNSQLRIANATLSSLRADLAQAEFEQQSKTIRAPFDGQIAVVNVANGSRMGNMHIYDTSRKFLEIVEPESKAIPIGATGAAWIAVKKPHSLFGFIDVIGAATVRLQSYKSYLNAM